MDTNTAALFLNSNDILVLIANAQQPPVNAHADVSSRASILHVCIKRRLWRVCAFSLACLCRSFLDNTTSAGYLTLFFRVQLAHSLSLMGN